MRTRRHAAAVLAAAAALTGAVVTGEPAAAAPACTSQPVANNDAGVGWLEGGRGDRPLRRAPYGNCGIVTTIRSVGTRMWIWCTAENSYENQWVWVRIDGTQTYGWIWNEDLDAYSDPTSRNGWCPGEPNDGDTGRYPNP